MATILFLAPADLGEAVLASGALAHVARAGDSVHIAATADAAPLFRAVPGAVVLGGDPLLASWLALLRGRPYDLLLDARGDARTAFAAARRRCVLAPGAVLRHRVEAWAEAVGADRALAPALWIDDRARREADALARSGGLMVLAPGGAHESKRWPAERFAAVARRLASGPLAGAEIVVLGAAARDRALVSSIVSSLDADGVTARDAGEGVDLLAAAALLERATLCIGNDNALTHIAAAAGAPTLTLFGPTDERVRAPWGPRTRTLRGRPFHEVAAMPALDAVAAMGEVSVDAVEAAALDLLRAGGL